VAAHCVVFAYRSSAPDQGPDPFCATSTLRPNWRLGSAGRCRHRSSARVREEAEKPGPPKVAGQTPSRRRVPRPTAPTSSPAAIRPDPQRPHAVAPTREARRRCSTGRWPGRWFRRADRRKLHASRLRRRCPPTGPFGAAGGTGNPSGRGRSGPCGAAKMPPVRPGRPAGLISEPRRRVHPGRRRPTSCRAKRRRRCWPVSRSLGPQASRGGPSSEFCSGCHQWRGDEYHAPCSATLVAMEAYRRSLPSAATGATTFTRPETPSWCALALPLRRDDAWSAVIDLGQRHPSAPSGETRWPILRRPASIITLACWCLLGQSALGCLRSARTDVPRRRTSRPNT